MTTHSKINRCKDGARKKLVTSLANGYDFAALGWEQRSWLRKRGLVNQTGLVTDKGKAWARHFLAIEADELMAGNVCTDFEE